MIWLCQLLLIIVICVPRAAAQNIGDYESDLHADLPYLSKSHFKKWYIYLVVSVLLLTFAISLVVVIRGLVTCARRQTLLKRAARDRKAAADLEGGHPAPMNGLQHGARKAERVELLSFVPSALDDERLNRRRLDKAAEEAMHAERARRLAQHPTPAQTLHALRRVASL